MFKLPALTYDLGAMAPWVSSATMDAHHNHHHVAYVDKLNAAVEQLPAEVKAKYFGAAGDFSAASVTEDAAAGVSAESASLARFIFDIVQGKLDGEVDEGLRKMIRNQGGGHFNHSLFWQLLTPKSDGQPTGDLGEKLVEKYGSFQAFTEQFETAATTLFGSGWAWLTDDLAIATTPNQDQPDKEILLGFDAWEHAYYLDYKWDRPSYAKAWWDHVNWDFVAARHAYFNNLKK